MNKRLQEIGHRQYVGGLWEELGRLQFDFMVGQGLLPDHVLLDIACGSLRAGRHFIPYLNKGNYLGMDKEGELIENGLRHEILAAVIEEKEPEFVISDQFDFLKFNVVADYALAQSLFTHIPPDAIVLCLKRLKPILKEDGRFYATFFIIDQAERHPAGRTGHEVFRYTKEEIEAIALESNWNIEFMGNWNHPRGQEMVIFRP